MAQALAGRLRLWAQKWRWYERNSLPWNRARIHWEFMRREAFVRWPVHGNVLEALREGAWRSGPGVLLEPGVWITAPGSARVRIGAGTLPEPRRDGRLPGAGRDRRALHARQRLLRLRRQPPLRRPRAADHLAGLRRARAPRASATNCWLGANVVVTSGVTIGERCVIGANSVVTRDIPRLLDRRRRAGEGAAARRVRGSVQRGSDGPATRRCAAPPRRRRFSDEPVPREMLARALDARPLRAQRRQPPGLAGGRRRRTPSCGAALRELYLPALARLHRADRGWRGCSTDPDASTQSCGGASSGAPTSTPARSHEVPAAPGRGRAPGRPRGHRRRAAAPAASSAAPRSTRSSRTCCWRCAPRASAPR